MRSIVLALGLLLLVSARFGQIGLVYKAISTETGNYTITHLPVSLNTR
jgi:hypothetical protein